MNRRIVVRPAAERDLDKQARYIASTSGIDAALRFYRRAKQTFEFLARRPRVGKALPFENPRLALTRMFRMSEFEKHLIFYLPLKNGIEVVRVIHGARDIEKLFEP